MLESSLSKIDSHHKIVLVGDFNATFLHWCSTDSFSDVGKTLALSFSTFGLHQHVQSPTHIRLDGKLAGLLDLVLTNEKETVLKITRHPQLGSSDHLMVECTLSLQLREVCSIGRLRTVWIIDKADWNGVNNALSIADWNGVQDTDDIDSAVSCWYSTFFQLSEEWHPANGSLALNRKTH